MSKQTKSTGKSSARATVMKNALALMLAVANALVSPGDSFMPVQPNTP
jgi:hypothetical protein